MNFMQLEIIRLPCFFAFNFLRLVIAKLSPRYVEYWNDLWMYTFEVI
jgi:hypothetical protein